MHPHQSVPESLISYVQYFFHYLEYQRATDATTSVFKCSSRVAPNSSQFVSSPAYKTVLLCRHLGEIQMTIPCN